MQNFFFFVIKVFFHIKNNLILSNLALKLLSVATSLTFCGNSFQRGITLFRKNSFLDVHIFAGSLRKTIPPLLKFLAAGPSVSPWTFFSGRFFHLTQSEPFMILQNSIRSPLFRLVSRVVSLNLVNLNPYSFFLNAGTSLVALC